MFKALYSHVNNIIEKYWQKKEKIKTKATIKPSYSQW